MATVSTMLKRSFSTTYAKYYIQNVVVIGGGLMGSGIAQVAAQAGQNVTLVDVNTDILKKSESTIQTSIGRVAKRLHKDDPSAAKQLTEEVLSRIKYNRETEKSVENADLVIEAIIENLDLKHKLFKTLDQAAPQKTMFASNTSSLLIAEIASVTNRKNRFGGLHFFYPVPVMKLLEVIRITETTDETHNAMLAWGKSIGKTCITCKDTPGFIVNRLLVPHVAEAVRMLERGDASLEDVDIAMKLGAGYSLGPLELVDYIGLDTTLFVIEGWQNKFPDNPLFATPEILKELVKQGKLGRKTGEGFYKYNK